MSQAHDTKIIVIGAGPVGCFVAYRLGKQGIPVTILEKEPALPYTPRAVGYYGATQVALKSAGLYDLVREAGFLTSGLCWRTPPVDDGTGHNKVYGEMIAGLPLSDSTDPGYAYPSGLLNLRQSELTQLLLREALATGLVTIHFQAAVEAITDRGEDGVLVTAKNPTTDLVSTYIASYLVGADGGKSQTRKLLNIPCLGHTWPERLISTDVLLHNCEDPVYHTCYVVGTDTPTILTPLSPPHLNTTSLWRYTMMVPAGDSRSDDELLSEENIRNYYEELMVGPRPLQVEIAQRAVYRIHQRLVPTMRRGRCVLVGDAAHLNNPYGAMGLNTGLLDADALSEALIMIVAESRSDELLTLYSDERRRIFQSFVDPATTANKLRMQQPFSTPYTVRYEDSFFRILQNAGPATIKGLVRPFFETWPTDMRAVAREHGI